MKVVVGTRGSQLALSQARWIIEQLKIVNPDVNIEVKVIKTKGDIIQNISLDKIGDKGLFVKEIEQQLLDKQIDIAIHSMKDMPSKLPEGLILGVIPKREDARDVLILKKGYNKYNDLPLGAKIGTGSKRRKFQLLQLRPDLNIVDIRGNVETRIQKITTQGLDGIILAAAGIIRSGLTNSISQYLSIEKMIPAPGQGALALEIRADDKYMIEMIKPLKDTYAEIQVIAERGYLEGIQGGCHIPMGAYCHVNDKKIMLQCIYGNKTGSILIKKAQCGHASDAYKIGKSLASQVLKEYKSYEG